MIRANMASASLATPVYIGGESYPTPLNIAVVSATTTKGRFIVFTDNSSGGGSVSSIVVTINSNPVTVTPIGNDSATASSYFDLDEDGALVVTCTAETGAISKASVVKIS